MVEFGVVGRPDFPSRGPKTLVFKGLGTSGLKNRGPKNTKFNHDGSNPPILGPLKLRMIRANRVANRLCH